MGVGGGREWEGEPDRAGQGPGTGVYLQICRYQKLRWRYVCVTLSSQGPYVARSAGTGEGRLLCGPDGTNTSADPERHPGNKEI